MHIVKLVHQASIRVPEGRVMLAKSEKDNRRACSWRREDNKTMSKFIIFIKLYRIC